MHSNTAKVVLQFKVCPNFLRDSTFVADPVRIIITDTKSNAITKLLGESGLRMAAAGAPFIVTRQLAEQLIAQKVACPTTE